MATLERCHNIADLRREAQRRLPGPMFHYLDGGADDEYTLRRNSAAFDRYQLLPRYLVDVATLDTATRVLGADIDWPVFLSPTGMSRLFHRDGERAAARAAHAAGTLYSLSTLSTVSIEQIAEVCPGPKLFQIYVLRDRGLNAELIERCRSAHYTALCLTVDVPVAGNRERDLRTGMTLPPKLNLMSLLDIARHPRWLWGHLRSPSLQLANLVEHIAAGNSDVTTLVDYVGSQFDPSVTWADAEKMIAQWGGPFAVKGILSAADARRAADIGATAVMISNHGGRQLDGAPAPIDVLPEIVDAVGDRVEVILDGGVRRGTHVVKALSLGARACMIGRAYLYGLGAAGEPGVSRALALLRSEVERDLSLIGCRRISECGREQVHAAVKA